MAIYHCRFKIHTRGKGATAARSAAYRSGSKVVDGKPATMSVRPDAGRVTSAVRAAAYRSGSTLTDVDGEVHDFTRKSGIVWTKILAPENTPEWTTIRSDLWGAVEKAEKRKDAQLFREVEISIPRELAPRDRIALVRDFVQANFVGKGMVADIAIHCPKASDGGEQPHAHVMLTMRTIDEQGFGNKQRDWNDRGLLQTTRAAWAAACNEALERAGSRASVSHLSLADQEKRHEPQAHLGRAAHVKTQSFGLQAKREAFLRSHFSKRARDMVAAIGGQRFALPSPSGFAPRGSGFDDQARAMATAIAQVSRQGGYRYASDGVEHARRTAAAIRGEGPSLPYDKPHAWELPSHER